MAQVKPHGFNHQGPIAAALVDITLEAYGTGERFAEVYDRDDLYADVATRIGVNLDIIEDSDLLHRTFTRNVNVICGEIENVVHRAKSLPQENKLLRAAIDASIAEHRE